MVNAYGPRLSRAMEKQWRLKPFKELDLKKSELIHAIEIFPSQIQYEEISNLW